MHNQRTAFTLIEVMVAVLIVSVVIAAIFEVKGNANVKLFWLKDAVIETQYNTFLLGNAQKYGFESSNISLYELVSEFDIESDLRRELKGVKIKISYDEHDSIDIPSGEVLEIGKTTLSSKEFSSPVLRVKVQ